jgi:hypothetical protein
VKTFWIVLGAPTLAGIIAGIVVLVAPPAWDRLSGGPDPEPPKRTEVRFLVPASLIGGAERGLNLRVIRRLEGDCVDVSLLDPGNPDAWRCTGPGRYIYDPCFSNGFPQKGTTVVCIDDPWRAAGSLLKVRAWKPLYPGIGQPRKLDRSYPWAVELSNGMRCQTMGGATDVITGRRVNYWCEPEGWIVGNPDRAERVWTADLFTPRTSNDLRPVDIYVAWF